MLITTMNDVPGHTITEGYGEVFGLTVRSRNAFSQLGAGLKSMLGGELKGMTKALADSRVEVVQRMTEEAEAQTGNSTRAAIAAAVLCAVSIVFAFISWSSTRAAPA